ncbi:helix-turn-helix domain-containing protein [Paenibacillus whitsoniae]|uniref:AraC family transcriptional regulator n=1 Tax=Paenibacillus whitsoniae TaxID=2496558 RepID=A0A430JL04_9BACL|nr:AraC family transcriptional regulator [Paenibacillus whitsoniae]RTE11653.1 AraC family transcriptional regulator [Paenibacillus whitsoniae]
MKQKIAYDNPIPINAFQWTPKTYPEPLHFHTSLEIGYCREGRGQFIFESKLYEVRKGDVFIVNNTELHIAQSDARDPSRYIFINFDPSLFLEEDEKLLLPFAYRSERFENHIAAGTLLAQQVGVLIQQIFEELNAKAEGYLTVSRCKLLELGVLLLRHYRSGLSSEQWLKMSASQREIKEMLLFVKERFLDPIQLTDVAAHVGWSTARTSRFFKEHTGSSFVNYVTGLRISEAKKQLVTSLDSVADISFSSGFQSLASFYRAFHADTGISPQEYRKQFGVKQLF